MSSKRAEAMSKMQASIDGYSFNISQEDLNRLADEDVQLDEAASMQSNKDLVEAERLKQAELKTEADIERLKAAKQKASSDAVKAEYDEEMKRIQLAKQQKQQEEKELSASKLAGHAIEQTRTAYQRVQDVTGEAWDSLGRVSTPGSIFLPIAVLLILFLLLLPVNGHTRIEWLWLALVGDAHLSGEVDNSGGVQEQTQPPQNQTFSFNTPGSGFTGVQV